MKRTVWDRIERVDAATAMDTTGWEGEDAPTNVAPPAFAKVQSSRGNGGGFWKGVVVGVGACAVLAGFVTVGGGAVIVVAAYGLPTLPAAPVTVVEELKAPVIAEVKPVATPVAIPAVAKVEPQPAPKAVARAKPEPKRAPAPIAPPPASVAKVVARPAPVAIPVPEPPRPNRDELLQLALAAKQTRVAPAPTPAPAPKWEEAEPKQDVAAAEEKWVPVDDTEATSTSTDSSSDDLSTVLGE